MPALLVMALASTVLVTGLLAQAGPGAAQQGMPQQGMGQRRMAPQGMMQRGMGPEMQGRMMAPPAVHPNYDLEARFLPSKVGKLVFDTSVSPHWFELSDRFWYSYETTDGTHYWLVNPATKAKTPLWDNAKVAEQLSSLTNFPYDAQHLPVKNVKLVNKDTT
ncbi:MAG: hypothetical protein ACRD5L_07935, partial [Bryobacteraceae bacterium]